MDERRVLLVEDNDEHAELIEFTLRQSFPGAVFERLSGGDLVMAYLAGCTADQIPHLVILDLKLPGTTGIEVLSTVKGTPKLRGIPVVMFTTSDSLHDRRLALENHANAFLVKPMDFHKLKAVLTSLFDFWLNHVAR